MREMRETADAFKKAVNFDFDARRRAGRRRRHRRRGAAEDRLDDAPDEADAEADDDTDRSTPSRRCEPPIVRPPGPTFHSAAPQQPKVAEAVEETASE